MLRVVLDANVWISAILYPDRVPGQLIDLAYEGSFQPVASEALIAQTRHGLSRLGFPGEAIDGTETEMRRLCAIVAPAAWLAVVASKESDNRILECAVEGRADLVVTGDRKHLLPLGSYAGIPIISPREFLDRFEQNVAED